METIDSWVASVEAAVSAFVSTHRLVLERTERQLSATFEIGCFHALLSFYEKQNYSVRVENLWNSTYRYLTAPTGNPDNFSFVVLSGVDGEFELRQQVRVRSHVHKSICFTPDLLVIRRDASIQGEIRDDYASGKRRFLVVDAMDVVAAHECKSTNVFPELLVSFVGMVVTAHSWLEGDPIVTQTNIQGHLAPTLFVGGAASALHSKMIAALADSYRLNVVAGLHRGNWALIDARNRLLWGEHEGLADEEVPF